MIYAGIGSRKTPANILHDMQSFALWAANKGYILRSGHAFGADRAFEFGHRRVTKDRLEIFLPEQSIHFPEWSEMAARFHPVWRDLKSNAKDLHSRNSAIIMGKSLDKPVDFVVCWTKDGGPTGGTGQGLRIAEYHRIPVFNMHNPSWLYFLNLHLMVKKNAQ